MSNPAKVLQDRLATVDLLTRDSGGGGYVELLVLRRKALKIKMYQELGHKLPHVHIDYANRTHVASYSIRTGERLAGRITSAYDKTIKEWIKDNRNGLTKLWMVAQEGGQTEAL